MSVQTSSGFCVRSGDRAPPPNRARAGEQICPLQHTVPLRVPRLHDDDRLEMRQTAADLEEAVQVLAVLDDRDDGLGVVGDVAHCSTVLVV